MNIADTHEYLTPELVHHIMHVFRIECSVNASISGGQSACWGVAPTNVYVHRALVEVIAQDDRVSLVDIHQQWVYSLCASGWQFDEVLCAPTKTHPCLIAYDDLDEHDKLNINLFRYVVLTQCALAALEATNKVNVQPEVRTTLNTQVGGSHYKDLAIQPVDYIVRNNLPYLEGNVIKYVTRHRDKNGIEDLKKAKQYIDFIIQFDPKYTEHLNN